MRNLRLIFISALVSFFLFMAASFVPKAHASGPPDVPKSADAGSELSVQIEGGPADLTPPANVAHDVELLEPGELPKKPLSDTYLMGAVKEMTLDDCINMALARSAKLKAAGYEVEAAQGQLSEAKAMLWPVLEYNWRIAPVPTDVDNAFHDFFAWQVTVYNAIHVGIGMPIMTFGQLHMARSMAKGGVEAAKINQAKAHETTIYQVKQLYYGIQLAKETIKLLEDAVNKLNDKIEGEEAKEVKAMDPYDLLQLKGFKIDMERRLDEARQNLEIAYDGLRIQMDLEPGTEVELDSDNLHPLLATLGKEQDYIDAAMQLQPESKLLDIAVDTKKLQYKLEKFKLFPTIGLGFFVDVGRTSGVVANVIDTGAYNDPFNYTRAGVGIQFKGTLDIHGSYGRIKKARAEYYKASYERLMAKRALALDIRRAYLNAGRAFEDVRRSKKAQSMARQMMFISKVNYDMGIGEAQRYGDALKYVLLTRGLYFKAVYDYNLALADLEQRIGLAKYQELTPVPSVEEYDAFDNGTEEEGYETLETYEGATGNSGSTNSSGKTTKTKGEKHGDSLE